MSETTSVAGADEIGSPASEIGDDFMDTLGDDAYDADYTYSRPRVVTKSRLEDDVGYSQSLASVG